MSTPINQQPLRLRLELPDSTVIDLNIIPKMKIYLFNTNRRHKKSSDKSQDPKQSSLKLWVNLMTQM